MFAKAILDLRHHQQTSTHKWILQRCLAVVVTLDLVERVGKAVGPRNDDTLLAIGILEAARNTEARLGELLPIRRCKECLGCNTGYMQQLALPMCVSSHRIPK